MASGVELDWIEEAAVINGIRPAAEYYKVQCWAPGELFNVSYLRWTHPAHANIPISRHIVCVHGLSRNCRDFDAVAQHLVAKHPGTAVIAIDMPGRGKSDWLQNKVNYNYNTYQMVATTVIASLGVREVDWIGISMGGILAMMLASLENCPIKRMVLVDIGPFIPRACLVRIGTYLGKEPEFHSVDEYKNLFKNSFSQFGNLEDVHWDQIMRHSAVTVAKESGEHIVKPHYDQQINLPFQDASKIGDMDLWAMWDKIKASVMLLRGSTSDVLPADEPEMMRARGPGLAGGFIEYADCGHTPHLFFPDKIDPIVKFLN